MSMTSCHVSASFPFPEARLAEYAKRALEPDSEVKPLEVQRDFTVDGSTLHIALTCVSARMARVSLQALLDNLEVIVRTMDELHDI